MDGPDWQSGPEGSSSRRSVVSQEPVQFTPQPKKLRVLLGQQLVERFDGEVPRDLAALVALPGVGRKTANVVLGTAFGLPTGVVVDTHVTRISRRLGLTRQTSAEKIERDLMKILPQEEWITFSHRVIHHGRQVCKARKPACDECLLREFCPQVGVAAGATKQKTRRKPA